MDDYLSNDQAKGAMARLQGIGGEPGRRGAARRDDSLDLRHWLELARIMSPATCRD